MVEYEKLNTLIQIASMYYENNLSQREIADKLNISRSYVSKLLIEAREAGIVEIKINNTIASESELEAVIRKKFGIKRAIVSPIKDNDHNRKLDYVGMSLGRYLYNMLKDDDIIGVSWGGTLFNCSRNLTKKDVKNVIITQLYGGLISFDRGIHATDVVENFAKAYNALPYFLLVPAIVDSKETRDILIKDTNVERVLGLSNRAQIAVFSVGKFGFESSLVKAGYFSTNEVNDLIKRHVVGDICARLFDKDGNIVDSDFNKRVIGIDLHDLCNKENSILVVSDESKAASIYGVLKGGYANVLVTDELTAKALLKI